MTTGTPTTAATARAGGEQEGDGDYIDPLDSYMASIANEVTHQMPLGTVADASPQTRPAATSPSQQPSPAQLAVARKVAVSPFCDVLLRGKRERLRSSGGGSRGGGGSSGSGVDANLNDVRHGDGGGEAEQACLGLLLGQPAEFLRRYGHILSPADLESFLPTEDPGVSVHVARLRTLFSQQQQQQQHQHPPTTAGDADDIDMTPVSTSAAADAAAVAGAPPPPHPVRWDYNRGYLARPCPPDGARVRNRRYRRLQQLAEGGIWFSDEAMKERDPWLWFEYVGKRAKEEKPAPRRAVEEVPGSTSVGTYLQESLGFLSQQQKGEWPTGIPNTGAAGAGSSLGMAFLSGMPEGGGGVGACYGQGGVAMDMAVEDGRPRDTRPVDVAAGATVDTSDLPASPPAAVSRMRSPKGDNDGDSSTAAVTAAVEAFGIRDGGGEGGEGEGGDVVAEEKHRVRVRFVDQEGVVLEEEEEKEEEGEGEEEEEEEDDNMEGGARSGGREEVARILSERFLAGEEEGVDYKDVDGDERLDDLDQLERDEEDRWFRSEEDKAASMEV